MRRGIILIFSLGLVLVFTGSVSASVLSDYTIEGIVELALEQNLELTAEEYEMKEAELLVEQAGAARKLRGDIRLQADYRETPEMLKDFYSLVDQDVDDTYAEGGLTLSLSRVIFPDILNTAEVEQARILSETAAEDLRLLEIEVMESTLEAVYDLLRARDGVELAERALNYEKEQLERQEEKWQDDNISREKLMEAQISAQQAEDTLTNARELMALAESNLQQTAQLEEVKADEIIRADFDDLSLPETALPWHYNLDRLKSLASEQRPEAIQVEKGLEAARIEVDEARAQWRPSYSLEGSYMMPEDNLHLGLKFDSEHRLTGNLTRFDTTLPDFEFDLNQDWDPDDFLPDNIPGPEEVEGWLSSQMEEEEEWELVFEISFNLFDAGLTRARVEEKEENLKQAQVLKDEVEEKMELMVQSRYVELKDNYSAIKAQKMEYQLAEQRLRDAERMHELEMATAHELDLASLGLSRAERDLRAAVYDYDLSLTRFANTLGLEREEIYEVLVVSQ